jgi:hypothetical protein
MDMVGYVTTAQESLRSLKTTRLGALRPVGEFIDWQRISWPGTMSEYSRRAGYNVWVLIWGLYAEERSEGRGPKAEDRWLRMSYA